MLLTREDLRWAKQGIKFSDHNTATQYHRAYGFIGEFTSVVQTGVLVPSPQHHRDFLESVYMRYEDKGNPQWNYEMRFLSYEILRTNLVSLISPRFNMSWHGVKTLHYPSLCRPLAGVTPGRLTVLLDPELRTRIARRCVLNALHASHFLHFAGARGDMKLIAGFEEEAKVARWLMDCFDGYVGGVVLRMSKHTHEVCRCLTVAD